MTRGRRSPLAFRLTLGLVGMAAAGLAVLGLAATRTLERQAVEHAEVGLLRAARVVHDGLLAGERAERVERGEGSGPGAARGGPTEGPAGPGEERRSPVMQRLAERYAASLEVRVTVIAADGRVLADSERAPGAGPDPESQATLPEVRTALAGGIGRDVRPSRALNAPVLYVAVPLEGPSQPRGVVRLAVPLRELAEAAASIRWGIGVAGVLAVAAALATGVLLTRRVTRPVARMQAIARRMAVGDLAQRVPVAGRDEIAELGDALNQMAQALREKVQTLEAERAEVAAILERMVEGVIALDGRGRVLLMNPAARAILGRGEPGAGPPEGRPLLEVVRQKALFDLVEASRAGGAPAQLTREIELPPPFGRILRAHAVAVPFAQGSGTVLVLDDVTELRRLERVRAEFVANVSHELRTPLTAIQGYLETLLDGALDDPADARRFLETAATHARRLGRLVDDLLQLSNVETGRVALHVEPLALRDVAAGVLAMFEPPAAQKRLDVLNAVAPELRVQADRDRLVQVLVNLVDNAVKYTPEAGQVAIGAARRPEGRIEVSVADTGIGIPSTDLPRISERFYRVDKARSRELGGTGLGLAIVKHLVQAQGGELRVESELGKGTTVRFTLPAA